MARQSEGAPKAKKTPKKTATLPAQSSKNTGWYGGKSGQFQKEPTKQKHPKQTVKPIISYPSWYGGKTTATSGGYKTTSPKERSEAQKAASDTRRPTPARPAGGHPTPEGKITYDSSGKPVKKKVVTPKKTTTTSGSSIPKTGGGGAATGGAGGGTTAPGAPTGSASLNPSLTIAGDAATRAARDAAMEYDPKLNELQRLIDQTTLRGKEGGKSITDMFDALSKTITQRGTETATDYANSQKKISDAYSKLKTNIGDTYAASDAADKAALSRLGIDPTGMTGSNNALRDQAANMTLADTQNQNLNDALSVLKLGAATRSREQASGATGEGMMRSQDLAKQVRDALTNYGGQKVDLQGSKGKLIQQLTDTYRQQDFSNAMAEKSLGFQYDSLAAQMGQSQAQLDWDKQKTGMGMAQAAAEMGAKNSAAAIAAQNKINDAKVKNASPLQQLQRNANIVAGRTPAASGKVNGQDYVQIINYGMKKLAALGKNSQIKNANQFADYVAKYNADKNWLHQNKWHQVSDANLRDLAIKYYQQVYKRI